jgi:membrane protein YdbS with pleckstrin-like domain
MTTEPPQPGDVPQTEMSVNPPGGSAGAGAPHADVRERGVHPAVQVAWMFGRVVNAVFLGVMAVVAEASLGRWLPVRIPLFGLLVFAAVLALGLWHARRLFLSWRWALRSDDVVARYGVVWRVSRSIPRVRVQHVDVRSGPVDRALGLVEVSLHVAGSAGPVLTIPGLAPAEAERLREALLDSAKVT